MMKRFLEWIGLKEKLDSIQSRPPLVSVGDIWWASLGQNVGSEINGKNELFSRPVVILKKLSHSFYFVLPTTSKERIGSWYVPIRHQGKNMFVCLHQARSLDYRRLSSKIGTVDDAEMKSIKEGFNELYK